MKTTTRRRLLRLAGWAVSAAMLAAAAFALRDRWDAVGDAGGMPTPGPVVLAALLFLVANAVLAMTWRALVRAAGGVISARAAGWVWAASQLTRYSLSAAQIGGRALLGRRYGLTLTAGGATALVEIGWQTALNALVVLATVPWWLPDVPELSWLAWAGVAPALVLLVGLFAPATLLARLGWFVRLRPIARLSGSRLGDIKDKVRMTRAVAALLTARYALNAALRLSGFLLLFAALGGDVGADPWLAVGAASLGQLVGRLAIFAPGGLGPRESATALVIAQAIGGGPAALLVGLTRLVEIAAELLFLLAAWLLRPAVQPAEATQ